MNLAQTLDIKTNYKVIEVIGALKTNLDKHMTDYIKAMEVYQNDLYESLQDLNRVVTKCAVDKTIDGLAEAYGRVIHLNSRKPILAKEMYEQYIHLFQRTTDETVSLSMTDANAIFNDAWSWARQAAELNLAYAKRLI